LYTEKEGKQFMNEGTYARNVRMNEEKRFMNGA